MKLKMIISIFSLPADNSVYSILIIAGLSYIHRGRAFQMIYRLAEQSTWSETSVRYLFHRIITMILCYILIIYEIRLM